MFCFCFCFYLSGLVSLPPGQHRPALMSSAGQIFQMLALGEREVRGTHTGSSEMPPKSPHCTATQSEQWALADFLPPSISSYP